MPMTARNRLSIIPPQPSGPTGRDRNQIRNPNSCRPSSTRGNVAVRARTAARVARAPIARATIIRTTSSTPTSPSARVVATYPTTAPTVIAAVSRAQRASDTGDGAAHHVADQRAPDHAGGGDPRPDARREREQDRHPEHERPEADEHVAGGASERGSVARSGRPGGGERCCSRRRSRRSRRWRRRRRRPARDSSAGYRPTRNSRRLTRTISHRPVTKTYRRSL